MRAIIRPIMFVPDNPRRGTLNIPFVGRSGLGEKCSGRKTQCIMEHEYGRAKDRRCALAERWQDFLVIWI